MRKWLCLLIVMLMIFPACAEERAVIDHAVVIVDPGEYLKGRSRPIDGDIMMRLYLGYEVEIVAERNGWYEIIGGELDTCWVCGDYIANEYTPLSNPTTYRVSSNGRVRLRALPGGKAVKWLGNGDTVTVTAWVVVDDVEWGMCDDGFVMREYLEVLSDVPHL